MAQCLVPRGTVKAFEGCGDGPKKAVIPGIAGILPHRTKVKASRDEIPAYSVGKGKGIKCLTKQYQLDTTTQNLTTCGVHGFKAAECFLCCSTSVSPTVSVVEATTMCGNFMWDRGRAECPITLRAAWSLRVSDAAGSTSTPVNEEI